MIEEVEEYIREHNIGALVHTPWDCDIYSIECSRIERANESLIHKEYPIPGPKFESPKAKKRTLESLLVDDLKYLAKKLRK